MLVWLCNFGFRYTNNIKMKIKFLQVNELLNYQDFYLDLQYYYGKRKELILFDLEKK